jgi:DNA-binding CsgD family transcriptional regulator
MRNGVLKERFKKMDEIIYHLLDAEDITLLRRNFLKAYEELLSFDAALFDLARVEHDQIIFYDPVASNIRKEFTDRYYSHFQYIDTMAFFFSQDKKTVYRTSDYINDEMRKSSEYYTIWLKPQRLYYSIGAKIDFKKTLFGSVNFWRSKKAGDYTKNDIEVLETLVKYVSQKFWTLTQAMKKTEAEKSKKEDFYRRAGLTPREIELAEELYAGKKISEIAMQLYISDDTVKKHSNHIYKKLNVKSKTELMKKVGNL